MVKPVSLIDTAATEDYWAHTPNDAGRPHFMAEHLHEVAEMGSRFAEPFGGQEQAYWAGWLHDIGKFGPVFQEYLRRCDERKRKGLKGHDSRGGGDHKGAGVLLSRELFPMEANPVAFTIQGHHGGMPDPTWIDLKVEPNELKLRHEAIQRAKAHLPHLAALPSVLAVPDKHSKSKLDVEMFIRMVFSCLVDADSLSTERHFDPTETAQRERAGSLSEWQSRLDSYLNAIETKTVAEPLSEKAERVRQVRTEVGYFCREAAMKPPGAFRLTVPTGGGKTLSSFAFALAHALCPDHPMQRIIYAIPYTSIIDQTARVFREVWGEDDPPLLLHHSSMPEEASTSQTFNGDGASDWRRLASQNWDAVVTLTTTVQLFESLASNRPGRTRKLHNIANSVLILDEAQMLPLELLQPIFRMLRTLVRCYGVTVVFCTATQPALTTWSAELKAFPEKEVTDIVPAEKQAEHFTKLERVRYTIRLDSKWTWEQMADEMRRTPQCLAVVNTRRDAIALLDTLNEKDAFHLSTLLCGAHRNAVLQQVRDRLTAGAPCHFVSTQAIECGCDLDFRGKVLRALGPFDRIIQSGGRCNREGFLDYGEVIIFEPAEGSLPPGSYRQATDLTRSKLLKGEVAFNDPQVCEDYFRELYRYSTTDKKRIDVLRQACKFEEVAREFRMIDADTVPVLVPYAPLLDLYKRIVAVARTGRMNRKTWQQAQPLLVNVYKFDIKKQLAAGNVEEILPDTLYLWCGEYDTTTHRGIVGILNDPADPISAYDPINLITP